MQTPPSTDTDNDAELRTLIRSQATRFAAPDLLRQRVLQDIRAHEAARSKPQGRGRLGSWLMSWLTGPSATWRPLAAGVFSGVLATALLGPLLMPRGADDGLAQEITAAHVRSLMVDHLSDVVSTDQHTVKPWYVGKLDYAPPVQDFSAQGFALVGGRIDYINQRAVAAVVYQHAKHPVNLFVWPTAQADSAFAASNRQGFNQVQWTARGMHHWLVSDLAAPELLGFAQTLQGTAQ